MKAESRNPPPTGTEAQVCADIAARQVKGIAKYGTTVAGNPLLLHEWLHHAYQECLDQAIYLRRAMDDARRLDALKPGPEVKMVIGFCIDCRHWEPIANEVGYCPIFQKRTQELHGTHCTVWRDKSTSGRSTCGRKGVE